MCGSRRLHTAAKIIKDPELSEEIVEAQGLDVQLGSRRLAALSHVLSQNVNMTLNAAAGLSCTHSLLSRFAPTSALDFNLPTVTRE